VSKLQAIPLLCPDCGRPLAGLRYDKVFFCKPCGLGLMPENGQWTKYPLHFAEVKDMPMTKILYLPFWRLGIHATAVAANRKQEIAARLLENIKYAWITAFTLIRSSYFGDVGMIYTEKGVDLKPADKIPGGYFVAGCTRTVGDAQRYAELYVTLILDKRADVTGMDIKVHGAEPSLWAVPMADYGDKIFDLISGIELPIFAFDDIEDIRRINRRA